jgi:ABC-type nitrate/sulfonate/bicarbonate transport system substrate-binding protein
LVKANQFMIKNREETTQILADWAKTDKQNAAAAYETVWRGFSPNGAIPEDGLRLVIEQARNDAKITRQVAATEVADLNFVREVQKELNLK